MLASANSEGEVGGNYVYALWRGKHTCCRSSNIVGENREPAVGWEKGNGNAKQVGTNERRKSTTNMYLWALPSTPPKTNKVAVGKERAPCRKQPAATSGTPSAMKNTAWVSIIPTSIKGRGVANWRGMCCYCTWLYLWHD